MDCLLDLWINTIYNDEQVQGSDIGPVVDVYKRQGCKVAVVDPTGRVLDTGVIYPTHSQAKVEEAKKIVTDLILKYGVQVIAIGNGTASKDVYKRQILESEGTLATSQIAADYGISARQLNKILHGEGIQHNVNGQWILYRKHMGLGYTKSKTIQFVHSDGRPDTKLHTQWTQKGRLMIHEILKRRGIMAVMDKGAA